MMATAPVSTAPIRVLIVDDHPIVREGIAALIGRQSDMIAIGEASDGDEAIQRYAALSPDVTLMDVQMPGTDGIHAIEAIRRLSEMFVRTAQMPRECRAFTLQCDARRFPG